MRIDKYLKVSRLVKRRVIAQELIEKERVLVNDKVAKKGTKLAVGDIILLKYGSDDTKRYVNVKVLLLNEKASKEEASNMYEIVGENNG